MKVLQTVTEVTGEGLEALIGENILVMCLNYFYFGKLIGVNTNDIKLENAHIVYETGPFMSAKLKDAQKISQEPWYVKVSCIESFGKISSTV